MIRSWNPGAERLYGYRRHEAVGLPGLSLVSESRHDDARMAIDCVLAGEPVQLSWWLATTHVANRRGKSAGRSGTAQLAG